MAINGVTCYFKNLAMLFFDPSGLVLADPGSSTPGSRLGGALGLAWPGLGPAHARPGPEPNRIPSTEDSTCFWEVEIRLQTSGEGWFGSVRFGSEPCWIRPVPSFCSRSNFEKITQNTTFGGSYF